MDYSDVTRIATMSGMRQDENFNWTGGPAEMFRFTNLINEQRQEEAQRKKFSGTFHNSWNLLHDED